VTAKKTGKSKKKPARTEAPTASQQAKDAPRKGEELYRTLVESALDGIVIYAGGQVAFANRAVAAMLGFAGPAALVGQPIESILHPDSLASAEDRVRRVQAGEAVAYPVEVRCVKQDGTELPVECTGALVTYEGKPAVLIVIRDITARKRAEEALREREEQLRVLTDSLSVGVAMIGPDMKLLAINPRIRQWFPSTDLTGHPPCYEALNVPPRNEVCTSCPVAETLRDGRVHVAEREVSTCDGRRYFRMTATAITDRDGKVTAAVEMIDDITERKGAEEALAHEAALLARAEAISHMGSWRMVLETGKVTWSDEMYGIFGLDRTTFSHDVGDAIALAVHPEDRAKLDELNSAVLRDGVPRPMDYRIVRPDGAASWVHSQGEQERDETGRVVALVGFVQDITERKRAEEALRENHERLALALDGGELGMWDWNLQTDAVTYSDRWARMLEYRPDEVERTVDFFKRHVHPEDLPAVLDRLTGHVEGRMRVYVSEHRLRTKSGRLFWAMDRGRVVERDMDGRPVRVVGIIADITERKRAEEALRAGEERYRLLFASMTEGVAHCQMLFENDAPVDFIYLNVNAAFEAQTGLRNVIGRRVSEVIPGIRDADPELFERYARVVRTGVPARFELFVNTLGEWFDVSVYRPHREQFVAIFDVITERKQAEEALRREQAMLARTEGIAHVGSWEWVIASDTVTWSDELFRIFQRDPREGAPSFAEHPALYHPDDMARLRQAVEVAVAEGTPYELELRANRNDGETRLCVARGIAEMSPGGRAVRLCGSLQDITERKRAEEALRESQAQFRIAQDMSPDGFTILHPIRDAQERVVDFTWVYENATVARLNGTDPEAVVGKRLLELFPGHRGTAFLRAYQQVAESGEACDFEADYSGESMPTRTSFRIVVVPMAGDIAVLAQDITERKRAEEALRERDTQFTKLASWVPGMIYQFTRRPDGTYCVPFTTEAIKDIFGCSPQDVREGFSPIAGVILPEDLDKVVDSIEYSAEHLTIWTCEYRVQLPGQSIRWLSGNSTPERLADGSTTWYGFNTDITDRKRAEEEKAGLEAQLHQAQKLESVGRLAGGVAHDFNNKLGVILGHAEIALAQVDPALPLHAHLEEIHKAAGRSADLTRQLLAFARKQTIAPKVLDLNETVEGMLKMLRRLIGEDIHLAWQPEAGLWPVRVDPSQIDQVLANLCLNARDAIADVGKITIETANSDFDADYCALHAGFAPGEYVRLAVSDDGCGMDKETLAHVFEPFFTTKDVGAGTGLGLATVYGIVKQNDGFINAYSEPGQGTTFSIYLPRHAGKAEQASTEDAAEPLVRGQETILLVEDEPAILEMTKEMLELHGYVVLAAGTPGAAIRMAREHVGEIHLLMTDVVMPEMNGRDLARNLLSIYPHLKRLFTSGYSANVIAHRGVLDDGVHFLEKPFSMKGLAAKVRQALESD